MSRTYKDQKQIKVAGFAKSKKQEPPLRHQFVNYKLNGHEEEENSDGDFCPKCGEPTDFELYYLVCNKCGWIDAGEEALEVAPEDSLEREAA